jgi:DNA-binding transcriptional LysR family regulator
MALRYANAMKEEILNLANLKYFCDAIRLGGLSAAAKANFVTQSAISQGISKLEKSLGMSLLAHHPNRLRPTAQGMNVFNDAVLLLNKIAHFQQNLSQDASLQLGDLEFACTHSFSLAVIPSHLKRFREEHPQTKVNFYLGRNENILQMVKNGTVDFAILPLEICHNQHCQLYEEDLAKFEKRTIYSGSFEFYASSKIAKADLKNLGFILTPSHNKETILLSEAYFKKHGRELKGILEVGSWETIANLVAEGMGIAYLPDYIATKRKDILVPCDLGMDRLEYRICAISPLGMKLRKSSEIFLSYFAMPINAL